MRNLTLLFVFSFFIVSCNSTVEPIAEPISQVSPYIGIINNSPVLLSFDNVPNSFWLDKERRTSLCLNVFIYDQTHSIPSSIIGKLYLNDFTMQNWTLSTKKWNTRIGEWQSLYTDRFSFNRSVLSLKEYVVIFYMNGGAVYTKKINPQILIKNTDYSNQSFIYSDDYDGLIDSNYYKALSRPVIKGKSKTDETLSFSFSVNDNRVKNGIIYFYTNGKIYIGQTSLFCNLYSKQYAEFINQGSAIHIDGKDNTINLTNKCIDFQGKYVFDDIWSLVVQLYDNEKPYFDSIDSYTVILTSKSEMLFFN